MGWIPGTDEKGTMASRSFVLFALALFAALALAPSAHAASPIAPVAACPGQTALGAPAAAQEEAMRCMTDYARGQLGLAPLVEVEELNASANGKSDDILRCDSFSHSACGRDFTYWMEATGYLSAQCWRAGENLAWGTGREGTVRSIFRAWMRSPTHRENVLGSSFTQLGVSLEVGELEGLRGTRVWTQHFGSHCEPASAA